MTIQEKCRILDHQKAGPAHYRLSLASPYIASHAEPGQFVNLKCSDSFDPLLRRPLSLHRIAPEHKTFELLYEVVGKGTGLLTRFFVGEEIDLLGPLGSGFKIGSNKRIFLLVGGGMGVAPLLALAEKINLSTAGGAALYILIGAKTKGNVLCEEDFKKVTDQVSVSTDDGSYGKKGLVSDILLDFIDNQLAASDSPLSTIYACGPRPMLKAIAEIASQSRIDCQLSMEERMACGIGACKGCAIRTVAGYKMVCQDGPVFDSREIVW
jgi:dihydroorotate dehydrogenase electron transfer subunit